MKEYQLEFVKTIHCADSPICHYNLKTKEFGRAQQLAERYLSRFEIICARIREEPERPWHYLKRNEESFADFNAVK